MPFAVDPKTEARFRALLAAEAVPEALELAMALLAGRTTHLAPAERALLWERFFGPLQALGRTEYQCQDFEIVDYAMAPLEGSGRLVRGPVPDAEALASGAYVCLVGAAQFFGRFVPDSLMHRLARRFGLPVLNLSSGGAGPQVFLEPPHAGLIARARLVVVQVMSGRSVASPEWPGTWTTQRGGEVVPRERVLREIWTEDRAAAQRLVAEWNGIYADAYRALARLCGDRAVLVWMAARAPDAWSPSRLKQRPQFGAFPHLVSEDLWHEIGAAFPRRVVSIGANDGFGFASRFDGAPCPFLHPDRGEPRWETRYYPGAADNAAAFAALAPVLEGML